MANKVTRTVGPQIWVELDDGRTPFDQLDADYIAGANIHITMIELQRYLNKHGWTVNEWANESAARKNVK